MHYKIKEAKIEFADEKIVKITCKWEDVEYNGKMLYEETFVEKKPSCGYMFLRGNEVLSPELLQRVCAQGQKVYKPCS